MRGKKFFEDDNFEQYLDLDYEEAVEGFRLDLQTENELYRSQLSSEEVCSV